MKKMFCLMAAALAACAVRSQGACPDLDQIERGIRASDEAVAAAQARLKDRVRLTDYRSLVRVVEGTNVWTDALQAAVRDHEIVVIPAADEPYFMDGTVVVPSHRRIEATGATIALKRPMKTVLLRNAGAQDGTFAPVDRTKGDENIAVCGGRWVDWRTGRAGYGASGAWKAKSHDYAPGEYFGVSAMMYFGTARNLTFRELEFVHVSSFCIQLGDVEGVRCDNIVFNRCNADGLHANGGCRFVHASRLSGWNGDDLFALNAYDWRNSSVNFGPSENILVEDVTNESGSGWLRLLPGYYAYRDAGVVDCAVRNVILRRFSGISNYKMYIQTPPYRLGTYPEWTAPGSLDNVHFVAIKGGSFEICSNSEGIWFHDMDFQRARQVGVGPLALCSKRGEPPHQTDWEVFDPWACCRVKKLTFVNCTCRSGAIKDVVHTWAFDNRNRDGHSSGRGQVDEIVVR